MQAIQQRLRRGSRKVIDLKPEPRQQSGADAGGSGHASARNSLTGGAPLSPAQAALLAMQRPPERIMENALGLVPKLKDHHQQEEQQPAQRAPVAEGALEAAPAAPAAAAVAAAPLAAASHAPAVSQPPTARAAVAAPAGGRTGSIACAVGSAAAGASLPGAVRPLRQGAALKDDNA